MSMAIKYAMNKKRMAGGGSVDAGTCKACEGGQCMEHGGLVDRVMAKRMSKGGMVANDTTDNMADDKEAQYDDLVLRDDLDFSYTGENSGDELGNAEMDENDRDLINRIMRSRAKRDRMPRPA